MTTRIETLAPEITALAESLNDSVNYYGGDYFLVHSQISLWNTRRLGKLTKDGAAIAERALRRMVEQVLPTRARLSRQERAAEVGRKLSEVPWTPRHSLEVTTEALDRGLLSWWMNRWDVIIRLAGDPKAEVRDFIGDRRSAIAECVRIAGSAQVTA